MGSGISALKEFGVMIPEDQLAQPITRDVAAQASIILAMDHGVRSDRDNSLIRQFPDLATRTFLFASLVDSSEEMLDPFKCNNPDNHRQLIKRICEIADAGFANLFQLASRQGRI